jgi:hypothetical protein
MNKIQQELEQIRKATGAPSVGLLKVEDVHEFARNNVESALHAKLPWDDSVAAHQWRLHLIRQIIRVNVIVLPNRSEPVRAYVSLTPDRRKAGGGYSSLVEVLSDEDRRRQMLDDALAELNAIRRKYAIVEELSGVFAAIDAAKAKRAKGAAKGRKPGRVAG